MEKSPTRERHWSTDREGEEEIGKDIGGGGRKGGGWGRRSEIRVNMDAASHSALYDLGVKYNSQ